MSVREILENLSNNTLEVRAGGLASLSLTRMQDADFFNELAEALMSLSASRTDLDEHLKYKIHKRKAVSSRPRREDRHELFLLRYQGADEGTLKLLTEFWEIWNGNPLSFFVQPLPGYTVDPVGPLTEVVNAYGTTVSSDDC